ncbi:hypothetical protein B1691_09030, partial [Geobacillus sp. 47C-IIb]|uniref:hypothetical protein n=1 Tax=Geobacillus sp. 47C-IIb TaxID=1963026 RepID=UPI0009EFADF5
TPPAFVLSQDQTLQKKVDWLALRFVQFSRNEINQHHLALRNFILSNHSHASYFLLQEPVQRTHFLQAASLY